MSGNEIQAISGLTSITTGGSITIAAGGAGLIKLQAHNITLNGSSGTANTELNPRIIQTP